MKTQHPKQGPLRKKKRFPTKSFSNVGSEKILSSPVANPFRQNRALNIFHFVTEETNPPRLMLSFVRSIATNFSSPDGPNCWCLFFSLQQKFHGSFFCFFPSFPFLFPYLCGRHDAFQEGLRPPLTRHRFAYISTRFHYVNSFPMSKLEAFQRVGSVNRFPTQISPCDATLTKVSDWSRLLCGGQYVSVCSTEYRRWRERM